jgi:hypothetical protein
MVESPKPAAYTLSPLSPNTLRILVLVEASNNSSKLSNTPLITSAMKTPTPLPVLQSTKMKSLLLAQAMTP